MGRILEDLICGALGYAAGRRLTNDDVKEVIDSYLRSSSLKDIVNDYTEIKHISRIQAWEEILDTVERPYGYTFGVEL